MSGTLDIQKNVTLAPLTSYKIGGNADFYSVAHNNDEIIRLIDFANKEGLPYFIFGGGFNIVFSDKGFRGLIIHNKAKQIIFNNNEIKCDAGILLTTVVLEAKKHNLDGLERLLGLLGTW